MKNRVMDNIAFIAFILSAASMDSEKLAIPMAVCICSLSCIALSANKENSTPQIWQS